MTTQWLDDREQRAWRSFLAMQARLNGHLQRSLLQHCSLSEADYAVLVHLSEAPEGRLRVFQLVSALDWEKSRLSHQLRRMAARGLVEREGCDTDRRGSFAVLTDAGRTAIERAAPQHVDDVRRWFVDPLSTAQLDALTGIAETVLANLERTDASGDDVDEDHGE